MTGDRETLREIDHTHPYTDRAFGRTRIYGRGRTVATDGGEADPTPEGENEGGNEDEEGTLADVEHTAPEGGDGSGSQRTFDRGVDR
jgi:hypothetical protein